MPEIIPQNVKDITSFQGVLRRLPEATPNVDAEYGFAIINYDPDFMGANQDWFVSIMRNGLIEVSIIYVDLPGRNWNIEQGEEDTFMFEPGYAREYSAERYQKWIDEVADPNRWRRPAQDFEMETHFEIIAETGICIILE